MAKTRAEFHRFVHDESGQDLIEYGLLIAIVTAGIVTTATAIGTKVREYYTNLNGNLQ